MSKIGTIILAACLCMAPLQLAAAQFDGSAPLLCAVVQIFECEADGDCRPVTIETARIPRFLKINFEKKTISATAESGIKDVSAIKNFERIDGKLILQGSENGRGWTIVISEETGEMSATVFPSLESSATRFARLSVAESLTLWTSLGSGAAPSFGASSPGDASADSVETSRSVSGRDSSTVASSQTSRIL